MFFIKSEMNCLSVGCHAGLFEGLGQCRMGMAGLCEILRTSTVFNTNYCLRNHLSCIRTNNMRSEYSISLLIRQNLDHSIRIGDSLSPRIRQEGENSLTILNVYLNRYLLFAFNYSSVYPTLATSGYV